jgi:Flp pilus assembly protein TadD
LAGRGVACTGLGRTGEATEHHRHALALFQENGERYGEACAHNGLGETANATGQPSGAIVHHLAALTTANETGAQDQQARAHTGLGHAYHVLGDSDGARRHYEHAVALYAALASPIADQIRARLAALDPERSHERPNDLGNR